MIWVLKGPGPEMAERYAAARAGAWELAEVRVAEGNNTYAEANHIAFDDDSDAVYVVTSAYHVPRAYLTLMAALRARAALTHKQVLHVWGTGTVTNLQMQSEAKKLADAQAKGHALRWEDVE